MNTEQLKQTLKHRQEVRDQQRRQEDIRHLLRAVEHPANAEHPNFELINECALAISMLCRGEPLPPDSAPAWAIYAGRFLNRPLSKLRMTEFILAER